MDSGITERYTGNVRSCPAQLLSFNLTTNTLIDRVKIPIDISDNKKSPGLLSNVVVETNGQFCEDTWVRK